MKNFLLSLCIGGALLASELHAQGKVWKLKECVDQAAEKNVFFNQNKANNEFNKINVRQSSEARFPTLNAYANQNYQFGRSIDPSTNAFIQTNYNTNNFGISSNVILFNGFQQVGAIRQNRMLSEAGDRDIDKIFNDLALSVTSAYLNVLLAYELLDNAKVQIETSQAQAARTERLVRAGSVAELVLYEIRSQVANDQLQIVNAQNQLTLAKLGLLQLMEQPVIDEFEIERVQIELPASNSITAGTQSIYEKALNLQPQIKASELRRSSTALGIKLAKGAYSPRLNLSASIFTFYSSIDYENYLLREKVRPFAEQVKNKLGEQVTLNLAIPILNNRIVKSNVERAKVNATLADLNQQNAKNLLRKDIEQAMADLKAAQQRYLSSQEAMRLSELTYQSADKRYGVGSINSTELLVQKNIFFSARSTASQAKYEYFFKLKVLEFYQVELKY